MATSINSISDVNRILYINLKHRVDRKEHVEKQLKTVGFSSFERFDAIKMKFGVLGCSLSHLKCLAIAKQNNWSHVLICEDDIEFLDPELFKKQLNGFLSTVKSWDVILLAGNNIKEYTKPNEYSIKVSWCQTTTGYLVKREYYDKLFNNIKFSVEKLMKEPQNHHIYAIDQYWTKLQYTDNWFLITPPTVVQRDDYSDIEKRRTNYKHIMLNLDKYENSSETDNQSKITENPFVKNGL